jgi:hypothetical protein
MGLPRRYKNNKKILMGLKAGEVFRRPLWMNGDFLVVAFEVVALDFVWVWVFNLFSTINYILGVMI